MLLNNDIFKRLLKLELTSSRVIEHFDKSKVLDTFDKLRDFADLNSCSCKQ